MIVVSVQLWSARDGSKTELARMHICNVDGERRSLRNYMCRALRGRSAEQLDKQQSQREGKVENWPSERAHVWNLVAAALRSMGYGATKASITAELSHNHDNH